MEAGLKITRVSLIRLGGDTLPRLQEIAGFRSGLMLVVAPITDIGCRIRSIGSQSWSCFREAEREAP